MESCTLLSPAGPCIHQFDSIDQFPPHPGGRAIPLHIADSMLDVDWPGLAIQSHAPPVPELEREDVGSGANFQNHRIAAGAVNGSGRNRKVIVFPRRPGIDVSLRGKRSLARFRTM